MGRSVERGTLWSIVLAGGEGTRMCPFIERWLGTSRPKQYCSFFGSHSLLSRTVTRLTRFIEPRRVVTVIGRGHREYLDDGQFVGRIIEQPCGRGTGPGVFLPAAHILAEDPEATVVISPSDHFISPEAVFARRIAEASDLLRDEPERIILIGAVPKGPEQEYGWIEPDACAPFRCTNDAGSSLRKVKCFREKPHRVEALHCFRCGHYWNTMIVVARLRTLWDEARRRRPRTMRRFETLRDLVQLVRSGRLPEEMEGSASERLYASLPPFDLCRDLLAPAATSCLLLPLHEVVWNDLGRPERLLQVLDEAGCLPNFPVEIAQEFVRSRSVATTS